VTEFASGGRWNSQEQRNVYIIWKVRRNVGQSELWKWQKKQFVPIWWEFSVARMAHFRVNSTLKELFSGMLTPIVLVQVLPFLPLPYLWLTKMASNFPHKLQTPFLSPQLSSASIWTTVTHLEDGSKTFIRNVWIFNHYTVQTTKERPATGCQLSYKPITLY
jgi:hypothetical protein